MPAYLTSGNGTLTVNSAPPTALMPGDEKYLFGTSVAAGVSPTAGAVQNPNDTNVVFETLTVGERSIAIQLVPRPGGGAPAGVMVQVFANANPGASEIDIQDAAIDADGAYVTPNNAAYKLSVWTQVGGTAFWTASAEIQPEGSRFITLKCIANPSAVGFTAKVVYV
jgi:hypothetical protein